MNWIAKQFALRRMAGKLRRRIRRTIGRPDNSPWVFETRREQRRAYVDFIFALDYLSPNSKLMRLFHEAMGAYGLSALLANQSNVQSIRQEIDSGWLRPHVYLDLSSRPGDDFEQLLYAAAEKGVYTLRDPAHTPWIFKAETHRALEQAGLPVPETVIIRADEADRELAPEERQRIGDRCVIKPNYGEAGKGVVAGVAPTRENIRTARDFDRQDDWLVQRMIRWTRCGERPGYVRGYNVCGHRTLLWWSNGSGGEAYRRLTWRELEEYDLYPALKLVDRLAELTGMDFFSTEIAILDGSEEERFCLIDYVNDQADMDPEAHPKFSPPESYVRWACERFAELTWRRKQGLPTPEQRGIFLYES